ncbi:MAG TPA: RagB/SusD family nutrient uptake outer membrane protein [Puia sp.]|nr:RagB/SusD family nutrient uptake outer membrane protein [Puia sp.]
MRSICIFFLLACIIQLSACKKFVELPAPQEQLSSATVFADDKVATSAITGLYTQIMANNNSFLNGAISVYAGLSSDELTGTTLPPFIPAFATNSLTNDNPVVSSLWTNAYTYIYQTNAILDGLRRSDKVSKPVKDQLQGEALFVRALCYFYLVNLFGNVPLPLTTDYEVNATLPRVATDSIYNRIIPDLVSAENILSADYVVTSDFPADRVRPNKWAAAILLSRVYLYQRKWGSAESEAAEVIDAGIYSLDTVPNVFTKASKEAIWQLMPVSSTSNTSEGNCFIPATPATLPTYSLTAQLLKAFEPSDRRRSGWLGSWSSGGDTNYYPYKYKVREGAPPYAEYNLVFRLAEAYLIRSEARAWQNDLRRAQDDLDSIRSRAGLGKDSSTDQSSLLSAIAHENQVEFFAEWGHRWLDLKRTNRANAVLGSLSWKNWQPTDTLYPIPKEELSSNHNLVQNPGY